MVILKSRFSKVIFAQALLAGLSAGVGNCWATNATPITLNGWNADVIYVPGASNTSVQGFDGEGVGSYAWFINGSYPSGGGYAGGGLPSSMATGTFVSGMTPYDPLTKLQTIFQLSSTTDNALKLGDSSDAGQTLTLATRAAYYNLAILAASGNTSGSSYTSTLTLNFSDGSKSSAITYNPYNWGQNNGPTVFGSGVGRVATGTGTVPGPGNIIGSGHYNMYETDIPLSSDGYSNKYIDSITFAVPASGRISVFAISGVQNTAAPLPEPTVIGLLAASAVLLLLRRPVGGRPIRSMPTCRTRPAAMNDKMGYHRLSEIMSP